MDDQKISGNYPGISIAGGICRLSPAGCRLPQRISMISSAESCGIQARNRRLCALPAEIIWICAALRHAIIPAFLQDSNVMPGIS